MFIGKDNVFDAFAQLIFSHDDRIIIYSHAAALTRGLDKKRKQEFGDKGFLSGGEFLKGGDGQAPVAPDAFGQGFVEGDELAKSRLRSLLLLVTKWYSIVSALIIVVILPVGWVFFSVNQQQSANTAPA